LEYLTSKIKKAITRCEKEKLYELRIRVDKPIMVNYGGNLHYLSDNGVTTCRQNALVADRNDVETVIKCVSEYSLYAVSDQLNKGYITTKRGERLGIAGEYVQENGKIMTIHNFTSVNVRFPHEVIGCSDFLYPYVAENGVIYNTLIISRPGLGKTTLLRDLCRHLSDDMFINLLVADERGELSGGGGALCLGEKTDVLSMGIKSYAFCAGLRALRPDVVATDELFGEEDVRSVLEISSCGVKILATRHAESISDLSKSQDFSHLIQQKVFERYVILSKECVGQIDIIYNQDFKPIYTVN